MTIVNELFKVTESLESQSNKLKDSGLDKPLQELTEAAASVGRA